MRRWVWVVAIVSVAMTMVVGAMVIAPGLLERRAVEAAREAGFTLTIAETTWSTKGITFKGLTARGIAAPSLTVAIDEVYLSGFSGREARVTGVIVALTGRASALEPVLRSTIADARTRLGLRHVVVARGRACWEGLNGVGTRADIGELALNHRARLSITPWK
jgi:hypothetical protein